MFTCTHNIPKKKKEQFKKIELRDNRSFEHIFIRTFIK